MKIDKKQLEDELSTKNNIKRLKLDNKSNEDDDEIIDLNPADL